VRGASDLGGGRIAGFGAPSVLLIPLHRVIELFAVPTHLLTG